MPAAWAQDVPAQESAVRRIAFGSCADQFEPQPIWDVIAGQNPDYFLFIGDNIYADTEDMVEMERRYQLLAAQPAYARFRAQVPVLATWDDHDYGINDGGSEYPRKVESKQLMLDFFGEPAGSERRQRDGVYTSYIFGPVGQRLQIILLDLRWFRSPLVYDPSVPGYVPNPNPDATILGADQWQWLEDELKKPAELRLIVSSSQFTSPDHHWEKWANFPNEKRKMLELLDDSSITNVFFISGDMHYGELSRESTPAGTTIYDLTSSGLNLVENGTNLPNRNRLDVYDQTPNFGWVEIDWDKTGATVSLEVRNDKGVPVIARSARFNI